MVIESRDYAVFSSLHREKPEIFEFYSNLQRMYTFGVIPKWSTVYSSTQTQILDLPPYPFQRENYELRKRMVKLQAESDNEHPLLGKPLVLAATENVFYWRI
jgi:acyl transferase domain-containing protein